MKIIIKELGVLLNNGSIVKTSLDNRLTTREFFRIYLLNIMISVALVLSLVLYNIITDSLPVNLLQNAVKLNPSFYQIIIFCLLTPLWEEIAFRLCLLYSKINISAFFSALVFILLENINTGRGLFSENNHMSLNIGLSLITMATIYSILHEYGHLEKKIRKVWMDYSRPIFYTSVLSYGIAHMPYFEDHATALYLAPLFLLAHIVCALIFSYTRLMYGLRYSVLLHSAYNLLTVFIPFLI